MTRRESRGRRARRPARLPTQSAERSSRARGRSGSAWRRARSPSPPSCSPALTAWPPHEDETLALFVGRELARPDLLEHGASRARRRAAPLPRRLARRPPRRRARRRCGSSRRSSRWRACPSIALLVRAAGGRAAALVATALVSASWMLLFHGIYGRMYSLFLLTSALSYLALLRRARARRPAPLGAVGAWRSLAAVATHPYGALVLASQGLYVLARATHAARRSPRSPPSRVLGDPVLVLATSCSRAASTSASAAAGSKLGGPLAIARLPRRASPATSRPGSRGARRRARRSPRSGTGGSCAAAPIAAHADRAASSCVPTPRASCSRGSASSASPESRHLIFVLPFFALPRRARARSTARADGSRARGARARCPARRREVAWGWHKTPPLFDGRAPARVAGPRSGVRVARRTSAAGRHPVRLRAAVPRRLGARPNGFSRHRRPRADAKLALRRRSGRAASRSAAASGSSTRATRTTSSSAAVDPAAAAAAPRAVRGARVRAVPRRPHARADRDAARASSNRRGQRSSSASRSTSATRTSTSSTWPIAALARATSADAPSRSIVSR